MTTELKGIKIIFDPDNKARVDWSNPVTGFDATVQCVLCHIGTSAGSDSVFPDRGTSLLTYGLVGRLGSIREAVHECNFASVKAKDFIEDHTPPEIIERISRIRITPLEISRQRLDTNISIDTTSGLVVGSSLSV